MPCADSHSSVQCKKGENKRNLIGPEIHFFKPDTEGQCQQPCVNVCALDIVGECGTFVILQSEVTTFQSWCSHEEDFIKITKSIGWEFHKYLKSISQSYGGMQPNQL